MTNLMNMRNMSPSEGGTETFAENISPCIGNMSQSERHEFINRFRFVFNLLITLFTNYVLIHIRFEVNTN